MLQQVGKIKELYEQILELYPEQNSLAAKTEAVLRAMY